MWFHPTAAGSHFYTLLPMQESNCINAKISNETEELVENYNISQYVEVLKP